MVGGRNNGGGGGGLRCIWDVYLALCGVGGPSMLAGSGLLSASVYLCSSTDVNLLSTLYMDTSTRGSFD